jgi:hypothetical protein
MNKLEVDKCEIGSDPASDDDKFRAQLQQLVIVPFADRL